MHWGHIAFYYLVEQMHRWERFVFKFDKQFASIASLKAIDGQSYPLPFRTCTGVLMSVHRRCTPLTRV